MSTFNGIVEEFPYIRVDYFRKNPDRPPPLACFLSHVHSDHLQGLESLRSPFVYCSAATREILLRMEKYPHRMNFTKGILEARKQHYKHLASILRPIPLHVPTEIELKPGSSIRVTLFDANHCPGAVMFLIEGGGKAILYTGDIRAEAWWVDNITRNPVLIPYTFGTKRLDRIYLDTAFATRSDVYAAFPSKAEGIRELIEKVQRYPDGTVFYLRTWTFGYEEVWLALATALNTQIHVDRYQLGLYKNLASHAKSQFGSNERFYLCGFTLGNTHVRGCLTDSQTARIHSCEPGNVCQTASPGRSVYITPVVTRREDGSDVLELGAGGGLGDLYQLHELQLPDDFSIHRLTALCSEHIADPDVRVAITKALTDAYSSKSKSLSLGDYGIREEEEISLHKLVQLLGQGSAKSSFSIHHDDTAGERGESTARPPNMITFPYSRHSSYQELCLLIDAFRPKDILPCTVDNSTWCEEVSMEYLFGSLCSASIFAHDTMMREVMYQSDARPRKRARRDSDSSAILSTQHSSLEIMENLPNSTTPNPQSIPALHRQPDDGEEPGIGEQLDDAKGGNRNADTQQSIQTEVATTSSELSLSTSKASLQESAGCKLRAIKSALEEKARNHEIDFYLPSLSPSSQRFIGSAAACDSNQRQFNHDEPPPPPSPGSVPAAIDASVELCVEHDVGPNSDLDQDSSLSLSSSEFDSQHAIGATTDNVPSQKSHKGDDFIHDHNGHSSTISRRTRRMDAYRAVRDGGSALWSSVYSPLTAGNNHSSEDAEL